MAYLLRTFLGGQKSTKKAGRALLQLRATSLDWASVLL
jgi:hypothetical protein